MKATSLKPLMVFIVFIHFHNNLSAQTINWSNNFKDKKHLLHLNLGMEYGLTVGLGYHYLIPIKHFPLWIGGELSAPLGSKLFDDHKVKLGTQIRVIKLNRFQFTALVQGISRRYQNQSVTLYNFGSHFAGTIGYYQHKWFFGIESGFDKAIVTNFKHSEWYRRNIYDNVQDGWYQPSTGGNFYYVLIGGISSKNIDFTMRAGKILQQDFSSQPLVPVYGQVGINFKF